MNYETAGADTPAAEGAQPEATVENSGATTEQQSEAETSEASASESTGDNTGDDAAAPARNWQKDRIAELTRKRRDAERRAERAERALQEAQAKDYSDLDYEDQIAERTLQRTRKDQIENERQAAQDLAYETYHARVDVVRAKLPDFDDVAHKGWEPTPLMLEAILDSEHGPDIAYHLGKNPKERARIAALPPVSQVRELGKLEARLTAPKPVAKQPPLPVQPVNGIAAGGARDPDKMSMSEYIAWRKGQN